MEQMPSTRRAWRREKMDNVVSTVNELLKSEPALTVTVQRRGDRIVITKQPKQNK